MAVTIEITRRGVYQNGEMVPVGEKLTMDAEPTGWVNKYRVVNADEGKRMEVASPEPPAAPEPPPARDVTGGKRRGRPRKVDDGGDEG